MSLCTIRQSGPVKLPSRAGISWCGVGDKRSDAASGHLQSIIGGVHLSILVSVRLKEHFKICVFALWLLLCH